MEWKAYGSPLLGHNRRDPSPGSLTLPAAPTCPGLAIHTGGIGRSSPVLLKSEGALSDGPPTHPRPGVSEQRARGASSGRESWMPRTTP